MRYERKIYGVASSFWAPSEGGYIRREFPGRPAQFGQQIAIHGVTLEASSEAGLKRQVERWVRANRESLRAHAELRKALQEVES